jgi:tetratricopeptide (TPR) repeat protein
MAAEVFCPDCGSKQPANTPAGLCPHCLLQLGLGADLSTGPIDDGNPSRSADLNGGLRQENDRAFPGGGGDLQTSGVLMTLDQSIGPVPRVLLRDASSDARLVKPRSPEMPDLAGHAGRYHLVGELARGGMGAVIKGRDVDLGRDLAIKVILEEHRDLPEMVRRFVEEAQIGGQLQHPGIVPVYELGRFPDGRLYIAMKLIRGRTLAVLLADRHGPLDDKPRFLAIFEQVCQTMAYAHSRGVVHRDLKPSNVMAGAFGEVHVMDWGLAKVLDQGGVADELRARRGLDDASAIRTVRTGSEAGESLAGSVLGTPAYMAPEQARAAIDTLDERADVFGLGSILCEILCGQPAYAGRTGLELYRMAERADLRDAFDRLDACGTDIELIALAKCCLAPAPKDRPRDAGVVLEQLTAYFRGAERRLREAGLAQAKAETVAAEERKRRILAVALASSILVTGLIGAGGWVWVTGDRRRAAAAESIEVAKALDAAARKRAQARSATGGDSTLWVQALEAARRAEALLPRGETSPELRDRVRSVLAAIELEREEAEAAEKDRHMVERLAGIHNDLGVHRDMERADAEYAAAFRGYGVDLDALDPDQAGARLARSPVAAELANALDQWAFIRRGPLRDAAGDQRLVAIAKAADPDPWRNRLRDTLGGMNTDQRRKLDVLERLAATADLDRLPEASVTRLAFALSSLGRREKAVALLRRTQRAHPDDFWVNADLGRELMASGKPDEAVRFFAVAGGVRPRSGLALENLGKALQQSGQFTEAAETFRQLIGLQSDDALAHVSLGCALMRLGEREGAEAEFSEAKRLRPDDWRVRDLIANAWSDLGDWNSAIEEHREAVRRGPSVPFTHNGLGYSLLGAGRTDLAIDAFRQAIRLDPRFRPASVGLGRALLAKGEFGPALVAVGRVDRRTHPWERIHDPATVARKAERMIALQARLPALLRGNDRPFDAGESAEFAQLCSCKQLYTTSARLWSDAFAARPELVEDAGEENRYQAARAAALAGCGLGKDDPAPDDAARERLRQEALDWINAELTAVAHLLEKGAPRGRGEIPKRLGRWQVDPAWVGLRADAALDTLPIAERRAFRELWSRVETLRQEASGPARSHAPVPPS